tara:strand:+ start:815 stop:1093 length:279 start_codon:yes stop_codon:yes gene_type:complete
MRFTNTVKTQLRLKGGGAQMMILQSKIDNHIPASLICPKHLVEHFVLALEHFAAIEFVLSPRVHVVTPGGPNTERHCAMLFSLFMPSSSWDL